MQIKCLLVPCEELRGYNHGFSLNVLLVRPNILIIFGYNRKVVSCTYGKM